MAECKTLKMKVEEKNWVERNVHVLKINDDELMALYSLLCHVGGSPVNSARMYTDRINAAVSAAKGDAKGLEHVRKFEVERSEDMAFSGTIYFRNF